MVWVHSCIEILSCDSILHKHETNLFFYIYILVNCVGSCLVQFVDFSSKLLVVRHPFERLLFCYLEQYEHVNSLYYYNKHGKNMLESFRVPVENITSEQVIKYADNGKEINTFEQDIIIWTIETNKTEMILNYYNSLNQQQKHNYKYIVSCSMRFLFEVINGVLIIKKYIWHIEMYVCIITEWFTKYTLEIVSNDCVTLYSFCCSEITYFPERRTTQRQRQPWETFTPIPWVQLLQNLSSTWSALIGMTSTGDLTTSTVHPAQYNTILFSGNYYPKCKGNALML